MSTEHSVIPGFDPEPIGRNLKRASSVLKAMSNQHRLKVLCQLVSGEKSVGELETIVGLSQSALSQHLARLRRENLVKTRRQAQTIFYSLDGDEAPRLIEALYEIYGEGEPKSPFGAGDGHRRPAIFG